MQTFSPSPAMLFPSMGRGADTAAPPAQDSFREVLANRLQAAMNSRDHAARGIAGRTSGVLTSRPAVSRSALGTRHATAAGSNTGASHQITPSRERKTQEQGHHTHDNKPQTQAASAAGTSQGQSTTSSSQNSQGNAGTDLPQSLRDFLAFLQSLPGGSLKIPQEQAPAVSSFLVSAGLPQAEVDRLLTPSSSGETSLTAADLMAAWQQSHGQGQGIAGGSGPASTQATAALPAAPTQAQTSQDIRQNPDYRALWERLTLPDSLLPTLRLALANLGGTPEALAQLDKEAQGHGIPLTRVWGILQNLQNGQTGNSAGVQGGAAAGAANAQAAVIGQQTASGAEMQDWRQMLLQAGLPPEVVDQLAGRTSPVTEEQLKHNLLSMAPPEEGPPVIDHPKPLYLPGNLRMRPFFWQSQTGGEQPQEQAQAQLNGDGTEAGGQNSSQQLAALTAAAAPAQTLAMPAFAAQLEGLAQAVPQPGSSTGETSAVWGPFSPDIQEPLWAQLQSGVVSNLSQGENQVTISLTPPDMGQIQLSLQLNGQDLAVTAVATRPEVAAMANQAMPQLAEALAQQGLVLTQFQVHVQGQPGSPVTSVAASTRQKGSEPEGNLSTPSRRRAGEVNRFV